MKILMISADNFEDTELLVPYYRLKEAGMTVHVAAMKSGRITGKHGYEVVVDRHLSEINGEGYDLLVLPGGKAPESVRKESRALDIARSFMEQNRPVAAICHGPQVLVSAGVLKGRRATCYSSVAEELKGAGALYEDSEVVVDRNLVTSREPGDLPAFLREMMKMLGTQQ